MEIEEVLKTPEKSQTLVKKVQAREKRRKLLARNRFINKPKFVIAGEIFGLVGLFSLNFWLLIPFFGRQDQVNVFSAPLFPLLATLTSRFLAYNYGIRAWILLFFIAFPLTFYYLVKETCKRKLTGFLASLIAILPLGIFLYMRVELGILAQDGGQVASLTLIMMICLFLMKFLRNGSFGMAIASSLISTLVALASPLGLVVLFIFTMVIVFSEILLGQTRIKLIRFLVYILLTLGFSSFWYNPQFVLLIINSFQGQVLKQGLFNLLPLSFFVIPLLTSFGFLVFENRPHLQALFIGLFWTLAFGGLSFGTGMQISTPSRFLSALGVSVAFLLAWVLLWFFDFFRLSPRIERFKIPRRTRRLIAFVFLITVFMTVIALIVFDRVLLVELQDFSTALFENPVDKIGIWEVREKTPLWGNLLGMAITLIAIILSLKVKFLIAQQQKLSDEKNH